MNSSIELSQISDLKIGQAPTRILLAFLRQSISRKNVCLGKSFLTKTDSENDHFESSFFILNEHKYPCRY